MEPTANGATPAPFQGRPGRWGGKNPCTPPRTPAICPSSSLRKRGEGEFLGL